LAHFVDYVPLKLPGSTGPKSSHRPEHFIEVKAAKAKTASRRTVPISTIVRYGSLRSSRVWSGLPFDGPTSNALPIPSARRAKVEWKRNGLRHSFISYRLAKSRTCIKSALKPVTVRKWFSRITANSSQNSGEGMVGIVPPKDGKNITPMPAEISARRQLIEAALLTTNGEGEPSKRQGK